MKTNIYLIDFDGCLIDNQWELEFQRIFELEKSIFGNEEATIHTVDYWEREVKFNKSIKSDLNPVMIKLLKDIKKYEHGAEILLFTNRSMRIQKETLALIPKSVLKLFDGFIFNDGKKEQEIRKYTEPQYRSYVTERYKNNYNWVVIDDKPEYVELGDPGSMVMRFGAIGS